VVEHNSTQCDQWENESGRNGVRHPPTKRLQLFSFWCIVLLSGRNLALYLIHLCPYFEGKRRADSLCDCRVIDRFACGRLERTKFERPIGVDKLCGGVMDSIVRRRPQGKSNRMPSLAALPSE